MVSDWEKTEKSVAMVERSWFEGEEPAWQVLGWPLLSRQEETMTVAEGVSPGTLSSACVWGQVSWCVFHWSKISVCVCVT